MSSGDNSNNNSSSNDKPASIGMHEINDTGWQVEKSRHKRRLDDSPKKSSSKRIAFNDGPSTSKNMFALLQNNSEEERQNDTEDGDPKPPPLIIPNVSDIQGMISLVTKAIMPQEFTYNSFRDGHVRLMTKSTNAYRTLVKYFDSKKVKFHTFQLKQERSYRVVLKNIHFSTPIEDIKNEIEKNGHVVRNIVNIKSRFTKDPLSLFFVDLEPKPNNPEIYNIKYLKNAVVKIEPPIKTNDIVQCHRCQQFGHSKTYCRNTYKCVKCGLNHLTSQCTKERNIPPQCTNCLEAHPASYKGCIIYKELLRKRSQNRRQNNEKNIPSMHTLNVPNFNENEFSNDSHKNPSSYANVLRRGTNNNQDDSLSKIEVLLNKQMELTNSLLSQFQSMLSMMSTLLSKLCN